MENPACRLYDALNRLLKNEIGSTFGVPRLRGSQGGRPEGGTPNQVLSIFQQAPKGAWHIIRSVLKTAIKAQSQTDLDRT
jgi:hypothetical protein